MTRALGQTTSQIHATSVSHIHTYIHMHTYFLGAYQHFLVSNLIPTMEKKRNLINFQGNHIAVKTPSLKRHLFPLP